MTLLLLAGSPAWTEEPASEENEPEESGLREYVEVNHSHLPTSNTIATKLPTPLRLTPANVGTVSAPLFEEQDAVLLGDSLVNVSGINVQTQAGVHDFFVIRGFDSISGSLILTDGDPLEIRTRTELAFIDGRPADLEGNRHERLYRKYRGRPRYDNSNQGGS